MDPKIIVILGAGGLMFLLFVIVGIIAWVNSEEEDDDTSTNGSSSGDSTGSGGASGKIAIAGNTATSEATHITFTNVQGAKTFAIGGGQSGVTNNGFVIRNVTDNTFPLVISDAGAATFAGTISSGTITSSGNIDVNSDGGQLQFGADNDMQIYHNGANGEINCPSTNFTIDAGGDIHLDADSEAIRLRHDGGDIGIIQMTSNDLILRSMVSDKDLIFKGNDGGSTITALTLDMSAAGAATFSSSVSSTGLTVTNTTPTLKLIESDQNKEYQVGSYGAAFAVFDATANAYRYVIDTSGNHSFNSGNATFAGKIQVDTTDSQFHNRLFIKNGTHGLYMGQWDGSTHRIEGDSNRPISIQAYNSGGITLGISGNAKFVVTNSGVSTAAKLAVASSAPHASYDFYNNGTSYMNGSVIVDDHLSITGTSAQLTLSRTSTDQTAGVNIINNQNGGYGSGIVWKCKRSDAGIQDAAEITVVGENSWNSNGTTSSMMQFATVENNSMKTHMTIRKAGNVGIGTTAPGAKLEVSGKDDVQGATDLVRLQFDNSPGDTGMTFTDIFSGVKSRFTIDSTNTNDLRISSATKMHFYGGTNNGTSVTSPLSIDENGRVGINSNLASNDLKDMMPANTLHFRREGYHGGNKTHYGRTFKYSEGSSWVDAIKIDWNNASWGALNMRIKGQGYYHPGDAFDVVIGFQSHVAHASANFTVTSNAEGTYTHFINIVRTTTGETVIQQRNSNNTSNVEDIVFMYEWVTNNRSGQEIKVIDL